MKYHKIISLIVVLSFLVMMPLTSDTVEASDFGGGTGEPGNPYQIYNWHHLNNVRYYLTSHFKLMANLGTGTTGYSDYNTGDGWNPIDGFRGTFDGNEYSILNLYINRPATDRVALFKTIRYGDAVIRDLDLIDVNILGRMSVGSLVAWMDGGLIERCRVSGSITATDGSAGGLIGYSHVMTIPNPYIGYIHECISYATVSGTTYVGGLIAYGNAIYIYDSYAQGIVSGVYRVGGLAGDIHRSSSGEIPLLKDCYSISSVSGEYSVGGLVGSVRGMVSIHNCYYDRETSGQSDTGKGIPKYTSEMKSISTFSNWDIAEITEYIDETWKIYSGVDYPRLGYEYVLYPGQITNFQSTPTGFTKIYLSWTKGEGITITQVRRKEGPNPPTSMSDGTLVYHGTSSATTATGLKQDTQYSFSAWGYIEYYNIWTELYATTSATTWKLQPPTGFDVVALDRYQLKATWTLGANADRIMVRYREGTVPPGTPNEGTLVYYGDGNEATVSNLIVGTTYSFSAWSYDTTDGVYSSRVIKTTSTNPNQKPYGTGEHPEHLATDVEPDIEYWTIIIVDADGDTTSGQIECLNTGQTYTWTDLGDGSRTLWFEDTLEYSTAYYFSLEFYDLHDIVYEHYWFTTKDYPIATSSNAYPLNGSTNVPINFDAFNIYIHIGDFNTDGSIECSNGDTMSWTDKGTQLHVLEFSDYLEYNTNYTVWVNYTDGVESVEEWFWFVTEDKPADEIWTIEDLDNIRNNLDGNYELMRNLDFQKDESYLNPSNKNSYITGEGWNPIGNFTGQLDGNDYTISNLFIDRPTLQYVGLFNVTDGALLKNIHLSSIDITGNSYIGGLVGYMIDTEVHRCSVSGIIDSDGDYIGGFVGYQDNGLIELSFTNVDITVDGSTVGGFVGRNQLGVIRDCYTNGEVDVTGDNKGGFVGLNNGYIFRSYSSGEVIVVGGHHYGGFCGRQFTLGVIVDCFYDTETSGLSDMYRGEPKTTVQMHDIATYYENNWAIVDYYGGYYVDIYYWDGTTWASHNSQVIPTFGVLKKDGDWSATFRTPPRYDINYSAERNVTIPIGWSYQVWSINSTTDIKDISEDNIKQVKPEYVALWNATLKEWQFWIPGYPIIYNKPVTYMDVIVVGMRNERWMVIN